MQVACTREEDLSAPSVRTPSIHFLQAFAPGLIVGPCCHSGSVLADRCAILCGLLCDFFSSSAPCPARHPSPALTSTGSVWSAPPSAIALSHPGQPSLPRSLLQRSSPASTCASGCSVPCSPAHLPLAYLGALSTYILLASNVISHLPLCGFEHLLWFNSNHFWSQDLLDSSSWIWAGPIPTSIVTYFLGCLMPQASHCQIVVLLSYLPVVCSFSQCLDLWVSLCVPKASCTASRGAVLRRHLLKWWQMRNESIT